MKKIVYILGIICAMTMQSCLDLEPKTQLADTNYWKSPEHFKLFATQFYGWSADFRWLDDSQHADIRSDLFAGSTVNIYSNGTNSIPSSDKHYADNYNRIRQVNTLLQQADAYEQQADIAISVGEARFFRAYCYFELLQAYGDLIIARTPLDIDSPEMQKARNPRTEVADFIIDDLKEAAKLLPVDKAISSSDEGRLSSEAALAFLSRVALYEGTWEKFHIGFGISGKGNQNMVCKISEFHEKLEAKLGCHLPNFQVFHERKKSDLHDQCHRIPEFHLPEAEPSEKRISKRYSAFKSPVSGDV